MHDFALVEHEIDAGIAELLSLNDFAAAVIADSMTFHIKANCFGTIAIKLAPKEEKKELEKLINEIIHEASSNRNMMAHSRFELADGEAVQFRRTTARERKVTTHDPLWSKEDFEKKSKRFMEIAERLRKIRPTLVIEFKEKGPPELMPLFYNFHKIVKFIDTPLPGHE
jgi:hypothetical protein